MNTLDSIRIQIPGSPCVFILDQSPASGCFEYVLEKAGCRTRCFTKDSIPLLIEEFCAARPRPALLVTGCLDEAGLGLAAAGACRLVDPKLKVLLATGFKHEGLSAIMAKHPVLVDATFSKSGERNKLGPDLAEFVAVVARLLG